MRQHPWLGLLVGVAAAGAVACLRADPPGDRGGADLEVPESVDGWTALGPTAEYDPTTIFSYIDGHAEVYLAYGLRRCLTRRYAGPDSEADIVVDLFELASSEDAFGVATYDRDGAPVSIGRDGLLRHGWLSFWQGAHFASVLTERETERSQDAVLALGRAIAAQLPDEGRAPAVVSALPPEGLQPREVRFLRHPQILNTHLFVDDENLLGLGPTTSAALGHYVREAQEAHLLLVDYPSASQAQRALEALRGRFTLGEPGSATDVSGRGWFAARVRNTRLAVVVDAGSHELASTLIDQVPGMEEGGAR